MRRVDSEAIAFLRVAAVVLALVAIGIAGARSALGAVHAIDLVGALLSGLLLCYPIYLWVQRPARGHIELHPSVHGRAGPSGRPHCIIQNRRRQFLRVARSLSSWLLGVIFASAASYKFLNFGDYTRSALALLPEAARTGGASIAIAALPTLEVLLVFFLLIPRWRRMAAVVSIILLGLFTIVLFRNYANGILKIPCGCNWPVLVPLAGQHLSVMLLRNLILILMASVILAERHAEAHPVQIR